MGSYKLPPRIIEKIKSVAEVIESYSKVTPEEMMIRSVPVTHPDGNRRYEDLVFKVSKDKHVTDISWYDATALKCNSVEVVCPDCNDDGGFCNTCNSTGRVYLSLSEAGIKLL